MHKIFTPASYLQCHPEYKKPATNFPTILDSFLTKVHCGSAVSGKPHHGWRWGGGKARVYFKLNELGRCKDEIDLVMGY